MAVSLFSHDVSDLCIGKPPLRSIPITASVGEALVALKLCGETFIGVSEMKNQKIGSKICMVDVICYLCAEENIYEPGLALKRSVEVLVEKGEGLVMRIETKSSILEALDGLLESGSSQTLIIPIPPPFRKKKATLQQFCWLTQEDLIRFFLNNIFLFSSVAPLSITSLGLVRPALLSVHRHSPALSALPLIRSALLDNTSVAVTTSDGKLIGEISPSTLSACDETVAPAIASLSAGDLMSYMDCSSFGGAPEAVLQDVKARLMEKGLKGMLELLEEDDLSSHSSSGSVASGFGSSSSSEEEEEEGSGGKRRRRVRRMRSGSYSARMGRRSEEAIVCHPESSLVAVMVQALAHRVSYVWVVEEEDYGLAGIVTFEDVLRVFREQLAERV